MGDPIEVFIDHASQPSRAVHHLALLLGLNVKIVVLQLGKGDNKKAGFLAVNPMGKVPALRHGSLCLFESNAILVYLAQVARAEQWAPLSDAKASARLNVYLHAHHTITREPWTTYFATVVIGTAQGKPPPPAAAERLLDAVHKSLKLFESLWLRDGPFIQGFSKPTVADLNACQEIVEVTPFLPPETLDDYPRVTAWLAELAKLPHWDEVQAPYVTRLVPALRKRIATATTQASKL